LLCRLYFIPEGGKTIISILDLTLNEFTFLFVITLFYMTLWHFKDLFNVWHSCVLVCRLLTRVLFCIYVAVLETLQHCERDIFILPLSYIIIGLADFFLGWYKYNIPLCLIDHWANSVIFLEPLTAFIFICLLDTVQRTESFSSVYLFGKCWSPYIHCSVNRRQPNIFSSNFCFFVYTYVSKLVSIYFLSISRLSLLHSVSPHYQLENRVLKCDIALYIWSLCC